MKDILQFLQDNNAAVTAVFTFVIAIATIRISILTKYLADENALLRKAGTEPYVVAYLNIDQRYKSELNLVIANIGKGIAKNIKLRMLYDQNDFKEHSVSLRGGAISFIKMLPQDEKISTFFGSGHKLLSGSGLKPFTIEIRYENIKGSERNETFEIDVSQFNGLVTLGQPAEHEIAEALKKMEKHMAGWGRTQRLKVETISTNQVREETEQGIKQARGQHNEPDTQPPSGT